MWPMKKSSGNVPSYISVISNLSSCISEVMVCRVSLPVPCAMLIFIPVTVSSSPSLHGPETYSSVCYILGRDSNYANKACSATHTAAKEAPIHAVLHATRMSMLGNVSDFTVKTHGSTTKMEIDAKRYMCF